MSDQESEVAVEISDGASEQCRQLGPAAEAAVAELSRTLEGTPLVGEFDTFTNLYRSYVTTSEGVRLSVHYLYGPPYAAEGVLQIGSVAQVTAPISAAEKRGERAEQERLEAAGDIRDDAAQEEVAGRQVRDAWLRIEAWLRAHATASYGALRPGVSGQELAALEGVLGTRLPAELKTLWGLRGGVHDVRGAGFMVRNWALMDLASVAEYHGSQMMVGDDEVWQRAWIPFCSSGVHDRSFVLYVDATAGTVGYASRYGERWEECASLSVYLEEMADALEAPVLAGKQKPGLVDGALVWGPVSDVPGWQPFSG
ncbi:SMI1/KNR4 family protein [Streptomyces sp. NPDC049627]|uniref:SMI1/KNR4 family protein n=1 Tax=Streptomyces sp. NPDC049627 TaxID=3365595 RepID=UPI0037A134CB